METEMLQMTQLYTLAAMIAVFAIALVLPPALSKIESLRKYGSKKFIISILLIVGATYLRIVGAMTGAGISTIFTMVAAGYGVANMLSASKLPTLEGQPSRKYIIAVLVIGCTVVLANFDLMTSTNSLMAMGIAGSMYGFTNHKAKKEEKGVDAKPAKQKA